MTAYRLKGVAKSVGGKEVLSSVDFEAREGEVTALVGPSGSGKSTLLRILNRLIDPDRGIAEYRGEDLRLWDPLELRREAVLVPQEAVMFPGSVAENVGYAARLHGRAGMDSAAALQAAGLPPSFLDRDAERLSGGERKRVSLARALALAPRTLLLDEPTAGVDPRSAISIEASVMRMRDGGGTVVWVTHDVEQALRVADRIANLKAGRAGPSQPRKDFRWGEAF